MDQATFNALMHQIGGLPIAGFFLVLARIAPLFVLAPLFSSPMVPAQVRTIVAVALALGMTGIAAHGQRIPTGAMSLAALMVVQIIVGLAFSLAVGAVFYAVESAGALIDVVAGFSYGQLIDPIDNSQGGVMTGLYGLVGLILFLAVGGEAWTLRGLARTFRLVPLTAAPRIPSLVGGVVAALGSIFISAIEIAAPVLLALLITDVAFGMVSRVVPQVNIFAVGFSMKIGVTLLVVVAALPFLGPFIADQTASAVNGALQTITTI
jgi:flagellar biosynthetic protein FliR